MDSTLTQIVMTLYQYSQVIDRLQADLQARDQRISELEARLHAANSSVVAGLVPIST